MVGGEGVDLMQEEEEAIYARHPEGVAECLKRATVGIAGLGGLGSAVATALARSGVGRMVLVDFDVVEASNLNRQHYFYDQIGRAKAEVLKENLRRINPFLEYEAHHARITAGNASEWFGGVDVLVEALDRADQKAMLLNACRGVPVVAASGLAGLASCASIGVRKMGEKLFVVGDFESEMSQGVLASRVGVVANMQAHLVVRILMGAEG
jgi:sulfur carrier protein ThiS adenylyltransferase